MKKTKKLTPKQMAELNKIIKSAAIEAWDRGAFEQP